MKKLLIVLLFTPLIVGAVTIPNPLQADTFTELLNSIIDFIFVLSFPIATIMILVAGFYFITARGEPERIETAKKIITWALIGLVIVIASKGLVKLLGEIIGVNTGF